MGNLISEGVAKIAGNVTQSVISAIIVFLITTYVLVGIGKKGAESSAAADSTRKADAAKKEAVVPPNLQRSADTKTGAAPQQGLSSSEEAKKTSTSVPIVAPPGVTSPGGAKQEAPARVDETAARKDKEATAGHPQRPPVRVKDAAEGAAARNVTETPLLEQTSRETVERQSTRDTAAVEKKAKEDVKKVKKRADEVFDELDQETGKNPPP